MTEQIRKYLIIPHVCIVISVKIEQLELCIREKNLKEFQEIYKNKDNEIYSQLNKEVQTMAERYVSKLIPRQRRIYLPKVQRFEDVQIIYREADSEKNIIDSWNIGGFDKKDDLVEQSESNGTGYKKRGFTLSMLDLIYERTGMRFWPETDGSSYMLPDNLRDMISWILMVAEMVKPEDAIGWARDKIYFENIVKMENYFVREWVGDNLKSYVGLTLQDIGNMDTFHMHAVVQDIMLGMFREKYPAYISPFNNYGLERLDTFFQVMGYFETINKNVVNMEKEADIYRIRALYTIRIHKLLRSRQYEELTDFFNGYIWGPSFYGLLPMQSGTNADRSRFNIRTIEGFNLILRAVSDIADKLPVPERGKQYNVSYITKAEERNSYLNAWIALGMFSNIFYTNNGMPTLSFNGKIIFDNNQIWDYIQISLENYLVALCNLDALYDKINLQRLGVKTDEFKEFVDVLKEKNQNSIQDARTIFANMDLLIGLKDFCFKNRDYKDSTSDGKDRTRKLVFTFFENIEKYMEQYGIKIKAEKLNYFILKDDQRIDISQLYSELFALSTQNDDFQEQLGQEQKQVGLVAEFRSKITELPTRWNHEVNKASSYLGKQSAASAKRNLDKFALRIQRYLGENKKQPEHLDVEGLCALYNNVIEIYFKDENAKLTQDMCNEYKRLVKVQDELEAGDE